MINDTIFISYSHKDESFKDKLVTQLGVLQKEGLLDIWEDRCIEAGEDWYKKIEEAIQVASVAILLVSADFLTSKFILGEEMPRVLKKSKEEGLVIFPVIIKPCPWKQVGWLARMNLRPKDGRPISGGNDYQIDTDMASIAEEIAAIMPKEPEKPPMIDIGGANDNYIEKIEKSKDPMELGRVFDDMRKNDEDGAIAIFGKSKDSIKKKIQTSNDPEVIGVLLNSIRWIDKAAAKSILYETIEHIGKLYAVSDMKAQGKILDIIGEIDEEIERKIENNIKIQ